MKYFFLLGSNPALSLAELLAAVSLKNPSLVGDDLLISECAAEIEPSALIKSLGGIIKIGIIRQELSGKLKQDELLTAVKLLIEDKRKISGEGKFNFGFSDYGPRSFNKKDLGIKLKRYFSEQKISSRFVVSQDKSLSSVVVEQNKLIRRGIEIVLAEAAGKIILGETLAVQPFKDLSLRDYGRPARDDQSGMLPPKLAQAMINLAQLVDKEDLLVDPFCGSGTVLSEALLLGYKNICGSDISTKAIDDTKKNISWVKELYKLQDIKFKFAAKSVLDLSKFVKLESAAAIVTEPYLGPQRGRIDFEAVIAELENLYSGALREFQKILVPGGRVVMVWPIFYGDRPISPAVNGFRFVPALSEEFRRQPVIKKFVSERGNIIYGREGQKVFREVVVLEKE